MVHSILYTIFYFGMTLAGGMGEAGRGGVVPEKGEREVMVFFSLLHPTIHITCGGNMNEKHGEGEMERRCKVEEERGEEKSGKHVMARLQ